MADVFISYKREERAQVERIAERLKGLGLSVWFDSRLPSGESFDEEINREIHDAKCVLVCWSPGAVQSQWVRAEAAIGRERDVLATVMLAPTRLYPPFNLIHSIDLSKWDGRDTDPAWLGTIGRIGALTGRQDLVERAGKYVSQAGADLTKPKKSRMGLVLAIFAAFAVVGVVSFFVADYYFNRTIYIAYDLLIEDPEPGIAANTPVYFSGIEVGYVERLYLDAHDPTKMLVRLMVNADVPLREDTTASIVTSGFQKAITLSAGSPNAPLLRPQESGPRIPLAHEAEAGPATPDPETMEPAEGAAPADAAPTETAPAEAAATP